MSKHTDVRLKVDGTLYGGWQNVRIQRSIEQITGTFELSVTERWSGQGTPRPIRPGAECQVLIDNNPVITGYVDDVNISYDADNHTVSVSGRDKTGDLVDSSAPVGFSLNGINLLLAAQRLCKPFGISAKADVDVGGPFMALVGNPGDSVFTTISAGAKVRGVLLMADGNGDLRITRASTKRVPATLQLGRNVLSCSASFSHKDRFSTYTVTGQAAAKDTQIFGAGAFQISNTATDGFIKRHRPLVIPAADLEGLADAQASAGWERNVRFGRSQPIQYSVQGWKYDDANIWPINLQVAVKDDLLGIDAVRLITAVSFVLDDGGMRSEITVMPREAFEQIPLPEKGDAWNKL